MNRVCNVCRTPKLLILDFPKNAGYAGGYRPTCRQCINRRNREVRATWSKEAKAAHHRKYAYGITNEQYLAMVQEQDNKCKICANEMLPPNVDHCHETKRVRGLLCKLCNVALGQFKDDPARLKSALTYLEGQPNVL